MKPQQTGDVWVVNSSLQTDWTLEETIFSIVRSLFLLQERAGHGRAGLPVGCFTITRMPLQHPVPPRHSQIRESGKRLWPQAILVVSGAGALKVPGIDRRRSNDLGDLICPSCFPHLAQWWKWRPQAVPHGRGLHPLIASWPAGIAHSSWIHESHSPVQERCIHQDME